MKIEAMGSATFLLLMVALLSAANAIQPDAEYLVREKQFSKQWAIEDKQVKEKSWAETI